MSESLGEAVLELRTDDRRYDRGMRKAHQQARGLEGNFDRVGASLASVATRALALGAIAFGGTRFVEGLVRARMELDKIDATLRVASGSAEQAGEDFDFVSREAERLGLALGPTALQFAQLSAAAKGTKLEGQGVREVFSAVAEASAVMQLSASDTEGVLRALQQMISKGVVSAEELRGQLGERLPGAFQAAARAMGVSTRELGKMLEQGELLAEDLLPLLASELRATYGPEVQNAAESSRAAFERLGNEILLLKAQAAEGITNGLTPASKGAAEALRAIRDVSRDMEDEDGIINWAAASSAALVGLADLARTSGFVVDSIFEASGKMYGAAAAAMKKATEGDIEGVRAVWQAFEDDMDDLEDRLRNFDPQAFRARMIEIMRGDGLERIDTSQFPRRRRVEDPLSEIDTSGFEDLKRDQTVVNDVFREAERIYESTRTPLEAYTIEVQRLLEHLQAGTIDQETFNRAVDQSGQKLTEAREKAEEATEGMSVFAEEAARNIQDHFADFLFDPFDEGVEGMIRGFATALQRMVAEAAAAKLLETIFPQEGAGGGLSGALGNALGNLFGGARAGGGPVSAGKAYLVGERGPEIIAPHSGGTVIPNGRIGGGGPSVQVIDQRGASAPPIEIEKVMRNGQETQRIRIRSEVAGMFDDGSMNQLFRAHGYSINHRGHR